MDNFHENQTFASKHENQRRPCFTNYEYNACYYNTSFVEDRLSGFRNAEPKLIISGTHGIKTGPKKMLPLFKDCLYMWEDRVVVGGLGLWCDLSIKNVVWRC